MVYHTEKQSPKSFIMIGAIYQCVHQQMKQIIDKKWKQSNKKL